ncbi:PP2C family protein-serine/threonine phosphatase [Streptomyces sp. VRA16 Mangrove soil]|uniref:PP2C family protein-serine/threonine phosphatase n=1 Tax=Streptomyces sp. VRA16 Mangrove soil TaxID=2817434 RepID=UPI001A9DDA2B|nr:PP2C family protein-serine/threonine phosphatase [Streptomyces sp. VRA16 Mangrove soil]MBO1336929.1 serine/threonine-protein phosphatase [Streptomyces sp. VRA16 Mangrove soil]
MAGLGLRHGLVSGFRGLALPLVVGVLLGVPAVLPGGWRPGAGVFLVAPLLACVRLDVRCTAGAAGLAGALALGVGAARDLLLTPSFAADYAGLIVGGVLVVRIAVRDMARVADLARLTEVVRVAQAAILHPVEARVGGIDVSTRHHCPVRGSSVGGDVFDVAHTPYGPRLLIGDVRGHGLDAIRTTALLARTFRDAAYTTPELSSVAAQLNRRLAPELGPEDFVTALFAEFAPGEVRLVNCGHPPPLRLGARASFLEPPAPDSPLGLAPRPAQARYLLQPGDRLLFYTDGLTEARDASGAEFPLLDRAGGLLSAVLPDDALDALYGAVTAHTGGPLRDDVALVLCEQSERHAYADPGHGPAGAPLPRTRPALPHRERW